MAQCLRINGTKDKYAIRYPTKSLREQFISTVPSRVKCASLRSKGQASLDRIETPLRKHRVKRVQEGENQGITESTEQR